MKLPQGDIKTKVWGNLTATVWRDRPKKKKVNILSNMHYSPQRVNSVMCTEKL